MFHRIVFPSVHECLPWFPCWLSTMWRAAEFHTSLVYCDVFQQSLHITDEEARELA